MSGMRPVKVFSLKVPPGNEPIDANPGVPASVHITMASIDPDEKVKGGPARATLRIAHNVFDIFGSEADEDDLNSDDLDDLEDQFMSDPDTNEGDEEDLSDLAENGSSSAQKPNGHSKSPLKSALKQAPKAQKGKKNVANGSKIEDKGNTSNDSHDHDEDGQHLEFVVCTLDPKMAYQVPLDITIRENEECYFRNTGSQTIYLNGNFVISPEEEHDDSESDEGDEDDLMDLSNLDYGDASDTDEDMLDGLPDPRVVEIDVEEEKPVASAPISKAQKNGRSSKDDGKPKAAGSQKAIGLPEDTKPIKSESSLVQGDTTKPKGDTPAVHGESTGPKESKRQAKKRKAAQGQIVPAPGTTAGAVSAVPISNSANLLEAATSEVQTKDIKKRKRGSEVKSEESGVTQPLGKKVQFDVKPEDSADSKEASSIGVHTVNDVVIDVRKAGTGRGAKSGDRVQLRYIGKLENGAQFDANKKGKPFSFKLGCGDVIKGWDIGVVGMRVGGERRITIPANLGYRSKALPGIPANSNLIFDLKLIGIN